MTDLELSVLKYKLITEVDLKVSMHELFGLNIPKECNLTRLEIPDGIVTIDLRMNNWESDTIKEVIFPKLLSRCSFNLSANRSIEYASFGKVNYLGDFTFYKSHLRKIDFDNIGDIGEQCFCDCTCLKSFDFSKLRNSSVVKSYAFSNSGITSIDTGNLSKVTFSASCFSSCNHLKEVRLRSDCRYNNNCFTSCNCLESVIIDKGAIIGTYCFSSCKALKTVIIKDYNTVKQCRGLFEDCGMVIIHLYNCKEKLNATNINYMFGLTKEHIVVHSEEFKDD